MYNDNVPCVECKSSNCQDCSIADSIESAVFGKTPKSTPLSIEEESQILSESLTPNLSEYHVKNHPWGGPPEKGHYDPEGEYQDYEYFLSQAVLGRFVG